MSGALPNFETFISTFTNPKKVTTLRQNRNIRTETAPDSQNLAWLGFKNFQK